ncbi:MAG: DUF6033 family protein [Roseburia sp.]|nr:DUF6033 family protein [Roseburia sp.]
MAVKVGNSWVSETAYAYAKSKMNDSTEDNKTNSMLNQLSEQFPDTKFSTNTAPFSGTGINNIQIAPNILKEMVNDPKKRMEYEALIYDCVQVEKTLVAARSDVKAHGTIIDSNGNLSGWSISEAKGNATKNRYSLDKNKKDTWLDTILAKRKQKKIEEKKIAVKKQIKKEEQEKLQEKLEEKLAESTDNAKNPIESAGSILDLKA